MIMAQRPASETPARLFWNEFKSNRIALAALALVLVILFLAILAPLITPQDPYELSKLVLMDARRPPGYIGTSGIIHWLGTDAQGRDIFSAILYGLRVSIQISITSGVIAFALGTSLGAMAAYFGGRLES